MYRGRQEYNRIDQLAIDIYLDYGFRTFPLDVEDVCRKLGVRLIPYSTFAAADRELLRKRSIYGFFSPLSARMPPTIFYNDSLDELGSSGCIRLGICHEIKHYADEDTDENPTDDDLAEHFGRYLLAPIPHLIVNDISSPIDIKDQFGVSATAARNIASHIANRTRIYGKTIFDYELPLIQQLDPLYYERYLKERTVMPYECAQ